MKTTGKGRVRRKPGTHDTGMTRAALLEAGMELFAEHGFSGTTAEMIAARARVNKAMINYHFRTKAGLYQEILDATFTGLAERLDELRGLDLPPDEKLGRFVDFFGELHITHPTISSMLTRELISGAAQISRRLIPHFSRLMTFVTEIVADGVRRGVFRPVNPFMTHFSLVSTLTFFFATMKAREHLITTYGLPVQNPTPKEYVAHIRDLFLRGLRAGESERR